MKRANGSGGVDKLIADAGSKVLTPPRRRFTGAA